MGCNRKPEIKNGGRQTGSTYISRSKTDRHAVRTARPGFSGSPDSTDSSPSPADVQRQPKRKMATGKPEVVLFHALQQTDTRFQRLYLGFRGRQTRRTLIDNSRRRPTPEMEDGDRQTGSSFISCSTSDRHTVRTARHGFSVSPDSTYSSPTPADVHREPKRKMATAKLEVVSSRPS